MIKNGGVILLITTLPFAIQPIPIEVFSGAEPTPNRHTVDHASGREHFHMDP